jgi:hypothetical protein
MWNGLAAAHGFDADVPALIAKGIRRGRRMKSIAPTATTIASMTE